MIIVLRTNWILQRINQMWTFPEVRSRLFAIYPITGIYFHNHPVGKFPEWLAESALGLRRGQVGTGAQLRAERNAIELSVDQEHCM